MAFVERAEAAFDIVGKTMSSLPGVNDHGKASRRCPDKDRGRAW